MKDNLKKAVGYQAADTVESGAVVGLGSGSTARFATLRIAQRLREGTLSGIVAVPTSEDTADLARTEGIPLASLDDVAAIDVTIDGADEVDAQLNVIKGLGGCLLREKIVAAASRREIIVVDDSKVSERLGIKSPVPVEVIRFGWKHTCNSLAETGARTVLRMSESAPFITDEGNYIIDCWYDEPFAPQDLAARLNGIAGVVENGLFLNMVQMVLVASESGVETMEL